MAHEHLRPEEGRRWTAGFRGFAAVVGACVVGLNVLAAGLVGKGLTLDVPLLKRERYAGGGYNAVVLGNSRVLSGVLPPVLDNVLARHGLRVRTFNWGIQASTAGDIELMADRLVSGGQVKLVLLQSDAAWYQPIPEFGLKVRMSTLANFGCPGDFSGAVRRGDIAREDAVNLLAGRVLPALRYRLVLRQFFWCCLTGKLWLYGQYQRMVHWDGYLDQELDALSNSSRKIKPPMGPTVFATPDAAGRIRALAVRLRERGVAAAVVEYPSCVYTPTEAYRKEMRGFFGAAGVPYLEYLGPEWFGNAKHFFDTGHLNGAGAEAFTRLLGEDLARVLGPLAPLSQF